MHRVKNREKKGPSQGIIQMCKPHERNPWAPTFEERTQDETSPKGAVHPRRTLGNWQRMSKKPQKVKRHILLSYRSLGDAGTLFDKAGRETFRDRLWSFNAYVK